MVEIQPSGLRWNHVAGIMGKTQTAWREVHLCQVLHLFRLWSYQRLLWNITPFLVLIKITLFPLAALERRKGRGRDSRQRRTDDCCAQIVIAEGWI